MPVSYRKTHLHPELPAVAVAEQLQDSLERERSATDAAMQLAAYQAAEIERLRDQLALAQIDRDGALELAAAHERELSRRHQQHAATSQRMTHWCEQATEARAWAVAAMTRCADLEQQVEHEGDRVRARLMPRLTERGERVVELELEVLTAHRWQECPCCQGAGGVGYWESEECELCDGVGYVASEEVQP